MSIINIVNIGSELGFQENPAYVSSKIGLQMVCVRYILLKPYDHSPTKKSIRILFSYRCGFLGYLQIGYSGHEKRLQISLAATALGMLVQ